MLLGVSAISPLEKVYPSPFLSLRLLGSTLVVKILLSFQSRSLVGFRTLLGVAHRVAERTESQASRCTVVDITLRSLGWSVLVARVR